MADWVANLPPGAWLFILFLVAAMSLLLCSALLLVAFVPSGAGRAGWRNPLKLPEREGIASWSQLHPAYPVRITAPQRVAGHADRFALARVVTDLQRLGAQLMSSPLPSSAPSSEDSA